MGGQGLQALEPLVCVEVLEACMVGGTFHLEWPRFAGLSAHVVCSGVEGMLGGRHIVSWVVEARRPPCPCLCLEVLEACMV